ncbi:ATP-binding cassette domain-containing protein [Gordonia sp. SID5947]|uniref:ATP-binding cassette domain-containing protein n=1 Tax=Gordonia sp. SID5947 TaxID=2690315 RepID=UPI001F010401|nr:ATP-binding cassette domain-containing protein [Gordonia sp. SID5947]
MSPRASGQTATSSVDRTPLLVVDDVHISYPGRRRLFRPTPPTEVIKGVSFDVGVGETVGLVGESGSGKSTIGKAVLGLLPVTSGSITFDGRPMPTDRQATKWYRHNVQAVFQDPVSSLNPTMTIGATIAEPIRRLLGATDRREITSQVHDLLDAVGLPARQAHSYPSELSGDSDSGSRSPGPSLRGPV